VINSHVILVILIIIGTKLWMTVIYVERHCTAQQQRNASNESKVDPKEIVNDNSRIDYTRVLQFSRKFFDISFCHNRSSESTSKHNIFHMPDLNPVHRQFEFSRYLPTSVGYWKYSNQVVLELIID